MLRSFEYEAEYEGTDAAELRPFFCPRPVREIVSGFPRYHRLTGSLPLGEQTKITRLARLITDSFRPGCKPLSHVTLVGHADRDVQRGRLFEQRISVERALELRRALRRAITQHIARRPPGRPVLSSIRWTHRGVGASQPVVRSPMTEQQRARNRRVEISLLATGPAPNRWDHAVAENRRLARSLAWQAYRSSLLRLLGFGDSDANEHAFAAAVARWQRSRRGLPVDGVIGLETLKRMNIALKSMGPLPFKAPSRIVSLSELEPDPSELRRIYLEFRHELGDDGEKFWTERIKLPFPLPQGINIVDYGHVELTEKAAISVGIAGADLDALKTGSAQPDKDPPTLRQQMDECQQRRHALRGRLCQEVTSALQDIRGHLAKLHVSLLAASDRRAQFELMGEALHLIQDSYSPAHMERVGLSGPIIYIRVWNPVSPGSDTEHGWPADLRDRLDMASAEGRAAFGASQEFLTMALKHIINPGAPGNKDDLTAYMDKHLVLRPHHQTIAALLLLARSVTSIPDPRYAAYLRCLLPDRPKRC
jgi:hypothetical protein